ncbi:MAG TPA: M23 family metallopeptidase [Candidatus Brocadiia bacterium]|nr:M23 family metallopeptidase [Candidatus Brocadiia bacterium]
MAVCALTGALAGCAGGPEALATDPDIARRPDERVSAGVPLPLPETPPPKAGATYVIQKGDTLWSIAQKAGIANWRDLLDLNANLNPQTLQVGQTIVLPETAGKPSAATTPIEPVPPPAAPETPPEPKPAAPAVQPRTPTPGPAPAARRGVAERYFAWPVRGGVACQFGEPLPWSPIVICRGVVLTVPAGSRVRAAKSGVAFVMESLPGSGRTVSIDHGDGSVTTYGYVAEILVAHGQFVRQGDEIAVVGGAESSGGGRLLFRIDAPNGPVDPLRYLPR